MSNARNARHLAHIAREKRLMAHTCENCGKPGGHWVAIPQSLQNILNCEEPLGFWVCDHLYGPDGRRLTTSKGGA